MSTLDNNVINHSAIRYGNEWQCSKCGKAWHVKDADVPECTPTKEYSNLRLSQIKKDVSEPVTGSIGEEKHLPFLLNRHKWLERRLDDIRFVIEICKRENMEIPAEWKMEKENILNELTNQQSEN